MCGGVGSDQGRICLHKELSNRRWSVKSSRRFPCMSLVLKWLTTPTDIASCRDEAIELTDSCMDKLTDSCRDEAIELTDT